MYPLCQELSSQDEQDADQTPKSSKCDEADGSKGKKFQASAITAQIRVVDAERREVLNKDMEEFARPKERAWDGNWEAFQESGDEGEHKAFGQKELEGLYHSFATRFLGCVLGLHFQICKVGSKLPSLT